jgi:hypothetical protein
VSRRLAALTICALSALSLAAADPPDDAVPCLGTHGGGRPPDLVDATGSLGEEGSTAVWRLTFAEPLPVPDPNDPPFRVDIVMRDPKVPTVTLGDYRRFNRIVRFDASSPDHRIELLFVPEGGHTLFDAPQIRGNTMTIQMPGRLLLGTDLFGRVDMQRLRWTVVVRAGGRCDVLGDGSTTLRLSPPPVTTPPSAVGATAQARDADASSGDGQATTIVFVALLVLGTIVVAGIVLRRRR